MRRAIALLGGVLLGVGLSQFPEYTQQYTQRLGGAVDELRNVANYFDSDATTAGLSREQALQSLTTSGDDFTSKHGVSMERTFSRYAELSAMLARVEGAGPAERLMLLPEFVDSEIGARTLASFKPAVPVTTEGFLYAGIGGLIGYLLTSALVRLLGLPFRARRRVYGRGI